MVDEITSNSDTKVSLGNERATFVDIFKLDQICVWSYVIPDLLVRILHPNRNSLVV